MWLDAPPKKRQRSRLWRRQVDGNLTRGLKADEAALTDSTMPPHWWQRASYLELLPDQALLDIFKYLPMYTLVPGMTNRSSRIKQLILSDANIKSRLRVVDAGAVDAEPSETAGKWEQVFLIAGRAAAQAKLSNTIYACPFCRTMHLAFRRHDHSFRCELCGLWIEYHGYCQGTKLVPSESLKGLKLVSCGRKVFDLRASRCPECANNTPPALE